MRDAVDGHQSYIAIDLKSFYASVECVERGLDPLTAKLVVADESRTAKTICLAVTPALKALGVPGRPRLFEVQQILGRKKEDIPFIIAKPRMKLYMEYSTRIFNIYQEYVAPEDMHVYSVDEVFMDVTHYLGACHMTPHELALKIIRRVLAETGITATAGIGTNLYLCKIAMDIEAKHMPADEDGVRIAELDERSYREKLWSHKPITDFWRIGRGTAKKLAANGMFTMGDVARCSLGGKFDPHNPALLYRLFGINAHLLIDHAWGVEPCRISDIKSYVPENNSISNGQVLSCPYTFEKARLVVREMTDLLVLDLVDKQLVTDQIVLTVGYDAENIKAHRMDDVPEDRLTTDHYGRKIPKHAHGSINLGRKCASAALILKKTTELYDRIVDPQLTVRRMYVVANHVTPAGAEDKETYEQLSLFDMDTGDKAPEDTIDYEKEQRLLKAVLNIKKKYGKNAILKGMNFEEGATARERNAQVGGHKA